MTDVIVVQNDEPEEEPDKGSDLAFMVGELKATVDMLMSKVTTLESQTNVVQDEANAALNIAIDAVVTAEEAMEEAVIEEPVVEEEAIEEMPIATAEVTTIEMPEPPKADKEEPKKKGGFHLWG